MIALSVNINKIATLRNARGGSVPNVLETAKNIEMFGAHGITSMCGLGAVELPLACQQ